MKIRPSRSGLLLLAGYLVLPGLLLSALLMAAGQLLPGLASLVIWAAAEALYVRFHLGTLCANVWENTLTVEWGTAFPRRWVMPLGSHVALRRISTPAMQLLDCCLLILEGPGGRVLLWAVPEESACGLEELLRGGEP